MKSMTKLMVVAMILAAALVVAPVAARSVAINGTNVFIGEEQLSFTGNFSGVTELRHYTGEAGKSSIDKTISVATGGLVSEIPKGIPTGSYYAVGPGLPAVTDSAAVYVNVQIPEATLDVMLNSSPKDSVKGKSITRGTGVNFKFYSNVDFGALAKVELTLPGGGVVTTYNGTALQFNANGQTQEITDVIFGQNAEAGTYTAVAKWDRSTDFFGKGYDSTAATFEILSKALGITANKDTVVRGNSFAVTITGESRALYSVLVKGADPANPQDYPLIAPGQTAVRAVTGETDLNRTVMTNAGGTATIQFNTTQDTEDKTFTIRVQEQVPNGKSDEVKVKVEAGSVTITTSGTGTYYLGEEITLSGTSTEGNTVYLFMTGPNLASNGVTLSTLDPVSTTNLASFIDFADVNADDTWSKKWNTGDLIAAGKSIDAGGYTIYAVSTNVSKADLSDAKYSTASVNLRSGFITATTSGATVARGDELTISGTAQGNPTAGVRVWIFGKNFYGNGNQLEASSVSVESDGSFEKTLKSSVTADLAPGQYFAVIQHPMGDTFGVNFNTATGEIYGDGIVNATLTGLQASSAANALITALDSPNVRDTYVKLTFVVEEPQIFIDAIGDKAAGSKFTITGTTNLAVGDTLNIEVTSAAFQPTGKTEASGFASVAGTTEVQQGDGANTWSFEVDGSSFKPDQYIVRVESIETSTTATATFNVVEAVPTTQATPVETTPVETTPVETQTTEPTPTQSPGFGALLALAGLGAVAFLVLRRD